MRKLFGWAWIGLCASITSLHAEVLVVDAAGGGDFLSVRDAVVAAADGDTVLVRPGDYTGPLSEWTIESKSIALIGDVGGQVLLGRGRVSNGAGFTVTLRGFTIPSHTGSLHSSRDALVLAGHGHILVEDCTLTGGPGESGLAGRSAISASNARSLSITRCMLSGGDGDDSFTGPGSSDPSPGGIGVLLENKTRASISACVVLGGHGGDDILPGTPDGGAVGNTALEVRDSRLYLSGSTVTGGDGGSPCAPGGGCDGGTGLRSDAEHMSFQSVGVLDAQLAGGLGGALLAGGNAPDGAALVDLVEASYPGVSFYDGEAYDLSLDAPLREDAPGSLTVTGPAHALIGIYAGLDLGHTPLGHRGIFVLSELVGTPLLVTTLSAAGERTLGFTTPSLAGTGLEGFGFFVQTYNQDGVGLRTSGASSALVLAAGL